MAISCERLSRGEDLSAFEPHSATEIERVSRIWRQLIQFDHDPSTGLNLAGGRLFVFIREKDARLADFSKVISIWQPA